MALGGLIAPSGCETLTAVNPVGTLKVLEEFGALTALWNLDAFTARGAFTALEAFTGTIWRT